MRKEDLNQIDDNYITQKLEEAFGYSDEQLIAELDRAAAMAAENPDPRLAAPDGEFEKIMARLNADKKERKVIRIKKVLQPLLVAAALGAIVLGTGIGVSGEREFEYWTRNRDEEAVVFNNVENIQRQNNIDKAYADIEKELGIQVLELFYVPKGMVFESLDIDHSRAKLEFIYNENYIHFYQVLKNGENSADYKSDRVVYKKIYNRYLDEDIIIYKNELEKSDPEFGMQFVNEKAFYVLKGIVEEEEFVKIVEKMKFYSE